MKSSQKPPAESIIFGLDRTTDEKSLAFFLKRFSEEKLMDVLVPRLSDQEINEVLNLLSSLMGNHLKEKEYHDLFLADS